MLTGVAGRDLRECAEDAQSGGADDLPGRVTDTTGTIQYSYVPAGTEGAGKVASVDGPWNNDTITFVYDALGRLTNRAINGVGQSLHYDALGRIDTSTNALGTFGYQYD